MRKIKALGAVLAIISLTMFPAAAALFQLGAGLAAVDRMKMKTTAPMGTTRSEVVGTYEVDSRTMVAGLRLHEAQVRRR